MTISELKTVFSSDTSFIVKPMFAADGMEGFEITHKLLGTAAFASAQVDMKSVHAVAAGKIEIAVDMPESVFKAWREYSQEDIV